MNNDLGVAVTVDETFDNDHRVVTTKGGPTGKFTFTAADSGDHRICFTPSNPGSGGWLSGGHPVGIKLTLDLAIGETSQIESSDKGKISEIVQRVKDLNARLGDIRREQVFQRVSCLTFLNLSRTQLLNLYSRNERPSSEINQSLRTQES